MTGITVSVRITVSDEGPLGQLLHTRDHREQHAPDRGHPAVALVPRTLPLPYPSLDDLDAYFQDEEGETLSFEVFSLSAEVSADTVESDLGGWTAAFTTEDDWYGDASSSVRATDPGGALVEAMADLDGPVRARRAHARVQRDRGGLDRRAEGRGPERGRERPRHALPGAGVQRRERVQRVRDHNRGRARAGIPGRVPGRCRGLHAPGHVRHRHRP